MGVEVVVAGAPPGAVEALFHEWDRAFSRFRSDSELCRVNAARVSVVAVSPLFASAVHAALAAGAATDGLVDPTLGAAIEAAGYDRDFAELTDDPGPPAAGARGRWRDVQIVDRLLERPVDLKLDLNGVVKALAVDAALQLVPGDGFVAAGGDVAVRGGAVVGLPGGGSVRMVDAAIATSGTTHRTWLRGGTVQHHLLDPRSGRPARSRWREVTVAAATCLDADVAAKAAFLLSDAGPEWIDERGLAGRFVAADGRVDESARWPTAAAA